MKSYGRYEIIDKIGQGAMGEVYKGFDPQIKREIALKVLREDRLGNEYFVKRFMKEAMAIGRLSHPNIVTVYDVGEDHGTIYIVMELLEGKPLNEYFSGGPLPLSEAIRICSKAADALHYAHSKGVIHRDVKTTNIIITNDNQVKLTDFGIARFDDPQMALQTQAGEILGTPAFMSPEQVLGKAVDNRSDLFSLGVILYELMTGTRPFAGGHLPAIFESIIKKEPDIPVHPVEQTPESLASIVLKSLAKAPEARFQTGSEMADALNDCLKVLETSGGPRVPDSDDASGTVFMNKEMIKASGVDPVVLEKPEEKEPDVSTGQDTPSKKASSDFFAGELEMPSHAPEKGGIKIWWVALGILLLVLAGGGGYFFLKGNSKEPVQVEVANVEPAVKTAIINVSSDPAGAFIYVDGRYKERTPARIVADYGRHEFRITLEGYFEQEFQLTVDQPEIELKRRLVSVE